MRALIPPLLAALAAHGGADPAELSDNTALAAHGGADPAELSDNTACRALGFANLAPFRRALPLSSPYGASTNSTPILLPYYSSAPLPTSTASTAVIFIHGLSGDANSYFCEGMAASDRHPSALILAPWFGNEATAGAYWNAAAAGETLFWSNSRWSTGGTNSAPPKGWSTSFDLLDALLRALPPSVALVSVVGFSAGAQLSGRYAFATPLGSAADAFAPHVRFFVGNPGSYLYLSPARPAAACSPLFDTGPAHTCEAFATPTATQCGGYNDYKYGLEAMDYLNLYLAPLVRNATARAEAVARFATKDVRIFLGSEDVCNCNVEGYALPGSGVCTPEGGALACSPDDFGGPGCCDTYPDAVKTNSLDHSCAAMLQGSNRLQRGLNYASHLEAVLPGYAARVFTGVWGHNNSGMYEDAAFQEAAYSL